MCDYINSISLHVKKNRKKKEYLYEKIYCTRISKLENKNKK